MTAVHLAIVLWVLFLITQAVHYVPAGERIRVRRGRRLSFRGPGLVLVVPLLDATERVVSSPDDPETDERALVGAVIHAGGPSRRVTG